MIPDRLSQRDPLDAAYERLKRVNRAIATWEEWHAAALAPDASPHAQQPEGLSERARKSLRRTLMEVIGELAAQRDIRLWERRN